LKYVLGIDPGLRNLGCAVIEITEAAGESNVLEYMTLHPSEDGDFDPVAEQLFGVFQLIQKYSAVPGELLVVVESYFSFRPNKTASSILQIFGGVKGVCVSLNIKVLSPSASTLCREVSDLRADKNKKRTIAAVTSFYKLDGAKLSEHEADALVCCAYGQRSVTNSAS
jgi:Holliday junction resolvasome RuvABC endonuclease subunit